MRTVRPCAHSGKRSGTRSWIVVARTPPRCGGYIQSEKCSTSKPPSQRSAAGRPARDHAVRQACAAGSTGSRRSTSRSPSASSTWRLPRADTGRTRRRRRRSPRARAASRARSSRLPSAAATTATRRTRSSRARRVGQVQHANPEPPIVAAAGHLRRRHGKTPRRRRCATSAGREGVVARAARRSRAGRLFPWIEQRRATGR